MIRVTTLRGRTALALGVVVLLTVGLLLGVGAFVIANGFGTLEQRQARERAALGVRQLQDEQQRITELALDYAAWDDMHHYAAAPTDAFIESAIPPDWLARVRLDLVVVLDAHGRVLFAKTTTGGVPERALPPQLMDYLRPGGILVTHDGPTATHTGLVVFSGLPWIVASRPIVTSATTGPIHGTFLLARRVDADLLGRFSTAVGLPITLVTSHTPGISIGDEYEMQVTSRDYLTAIAPLQDVSKRIIGWLAVRVPRRIEAQRRITQYYLVASLLAATIVLVAAVLFLLDRYIVGRVATLAKFLGDVEGSGDLTARVAVVHADEIGRVATAVNTLLGTLNHRNQEIEEARAEACAALEESARKNRELEQANLTIARLASTDDLTGLANRRVFDRRLQEQIARATRTREAFTVIMADIDHFKAVNDNYGHPTGDLVLVHVASTLVANLRGYDLGARHGGEEFAILLPGVGIDEGKIVAERIRGDIEQLVVPNYNRRVTISLGVAEWQPGDSGDRLMSRADEGLYRAKGAGRNRVAAVVPELTLSWRPNGAAVA